MTTQPLPSVGQPIADPATGYVTVPWYRFFTRPFSAVLDGWFGAVQGSIIYRGATAWEALPPGTAGQVLVTGGPAANPYWADTDSGNAIGTGA